MPVRVMSAAPRRQVRPAWSSSRSPSLRTPGRVAPPRRMRARSAREEDGVGEGLGEEVVGAGVEGLDLVVLAVLGGEHEDGRRVALVPQPPADAVAVQAGQHDVEDDRGVGVLGGVPQRIPPVVRDVDGVALGAEPGPQRFGQPPLILDEQDPHRATMPQPATNTPTRPPRSDNAGSCARGTVGVRGLGPREMRRSEGRSPERKRRPAQPTWGSLGAGRRVLA